MKQLPKSLVEKQNEKQLRCNNNHCEKVMPLFGVTTLAQLKDSAEKASSAKDMRHTRAWDTAPTILTSVPYDEIGTLV